MESEAEASAEPARAVEPDTASTRPSSRVVGRVLALSVVIAAAALALYVFGVRDLPPVHSSMTVPWVVLAVGFAASELTVVHIEFRRDAHSVSLNEIPLVVALAFTSPSHLVLAQLLGAGAVLVLHRRQALLKLGFNLAHFALEDSVAIVVFHLYVHHAIRVESALWIGGIAAAVAAATVSVLTVSIVIWVHQNRLALGQLRAVVGVAITGAVFNACVGLVAVTVLLVDARGAILLAVIAAVLCAAYREYASLRQRHASLELLYEFTQAVRAEGDAELIMGDVLAQARDMLRADTAEIALFPSDDHDTTDWMVLAGDSTMPARSTELRPDPRLVTLLEPGVTVIGARSARDQRIRDYLEYRGQRDCILAPLIADDRIIGVLTVANRLGDISTFDEQDGRLFETVAAHTSITLEKASLVDRLRHDALHDSLTGLPNRVLFLQRLAELLTRQRPGDPHLVVMLIDLDRFKEINDTLGHATGDLLLQEVADRLRRGVPEQVTVARLGGDEFALLHPALDEAELAVGLARDLREELRRPFRYEDLELEVSATIGISIAPARDGHDASTLLRRADVAMYSAKNMPLGVAAYGESLDENSPRKLALVGELRAVIERGGLDVYYQPKLDMVTGKVIGAEALVRWPHPVVGLVAPDEFVPIAERIGLVGPLTDFVLRRALAECRRWNDAGHEMTVAVNLSARSLVDPELVEHIEGALRTSGVHVSKLVLEITETSVMSDAEYAMRALNGLSAMGVTLAIDDFGTGYSSLSYLKRLPVDEVKIDKSFVLNMHRDANDAVIVRSIIDLARNLGLLVVAEGVETAPTWDVLRELGCDIAQGFLISRPMDSVAFARWLHTNATRPFLGSLAAGPVTAGPPP